MPDHRSYHRNGSRDDAEVKLVSSSVIVGIRAPLFTRGNVQLCGINNWTYKLCVESPDLRLEPTTSQPCCSIFSFQEETNETAVSFLKCLSASSSSFGCWTNLLHPCYKISVPASKIYKAFNLFLFSECQNNERIFLYILSSESEVYVN